MAKAVVRICTLARQLGYLVESRLVVDRLTPNPSLYSCINECIRVIISCTGDLECCIIQFD